MRAKIRCECTCIVCGTMSAASTYYKNSNTISKLKKNIKDWVWLDELAGNVCPKCQKTSWIYNEWRIYRQLDKKKVKVL